MKMDLDGQVGCVGKENRSAVIIHASASALLDVNKKVSEYEDRHRILSDTMNEILLKILINNHF